MNAQRVKWIDTLRGFGIFIVFLGHTTLTNKQIEHYIFSFHLPLFFFISGIFFKASDASRSFRKFCLERIKARMIPYISFGLLTYCIWLFPILLKKHGIYQGSHPIPDSLFYKPLLGMLYGIGDSEWLPHNSILWFLACLFVTEMIFSIMYSTIKTKRTMLLALLLFGILGYIDAVYSQIRMPFSLDVAFTAVVFYGLGYLLRDQLLSSDFGIGSAFICLLLGLGIGFLNSRVDMNYSNYGNPLLFYASSLSSIYAYICLAKRIPNNRLIGYVGQNSLVFFLLQDEGFFAVNVLAYLILQTRPNSIEPNMIYACSYVLLSLLALFPAVYIINSKIPIMTGRFTRQATR
ncbi:MAG: acyltransferase family protein [Syntrophales bacterium]|jgi:acyltransferase